MENFNDMINEYKDIYTKFSKIEGRVWNAEAITLELTKQMGELAKSIMMYEKYYFPSRANNPKYKVDLDTIGDELADIMGNVIRLADFYKIDLYDSYKKARIVERESLEVLLKEEKNENSSFF